MRLDDADGDGQLQCLVIVDSDVNGFAATLVGIALIVAVHMAFVIMVVVMLVVIMILMISRILDCIMSFGGDSTLGRLRLLGGSLL